ncbi:hypothetical protein L0N33_21115, partial [Roseburia faecis]|nr:hypothetical protein [Roseburia faecis]
MSTNGWIIPASKWILRSCSFTPLIFDWTFFGRLFSRLAFRNWLGLWFNTVSARFIGSWRAYWPSSSCLLALLLGLIDASSDNRY